MKKIFTAIVAMVILTATATFANEPNKNTVDERIEKSFKREFATAEGINWTKINDIYKAQFSMNGQVMFAYLNEEGTILGTYRNILSSQLPMPLMTELKADYTGFWITELFELAKENQTNYFVTIENGDQTIVLKSENANTWNVKSKNRK